MPVAEKKPGGKWWGEFKLGLGGCGRWKIGPATIWVEREKHEWRIFYEGGGDPQDSTVEIDFGAHNRDAIPAGAIMTRVGVRATAELIEIMPALADRGVVVRPEKPFYVLPGEEVSFYVGTPLWLRIESGRQKASLIDLPLHRPSDTWFGPSTKEGEICYASRISGKLSPEEISFRPHRASTAMLLRNRSAESVLLDRFNLPVPHLSLYHDQNWNLWTQTVALELGERDQEASLRLNASAPKEALSARHLAGPRQKADQNILTRTLGYLIG